MTQWVDFRQLTETVSIEQVLDQLGLLNDLRRVKENELVGLCPFHEETKASFHVSLSKGLWHCFGCEAKGNIISLVAQKQGTGVREAALMIQGWFVTALEMPLSPPESGLQDAGGDKEPETGENPPLTFELSNLDPNHPYLTQRGLKPQTIQEFGLGYCTRGLMKNRVVIPIHDQEKGGRLIGYAGRYPEEDVPEDQPKYLVPPNFKKSQVLFNIHRALDAGAKEQELILVEGFFDLFHIYQAGFKNVVALMGSQLYPAQQSQIESALGSAGKVLIMMDADEAGANCERQCIEALAPHLYVKAIRLPDGVAQPDELTEEQIQQLLAG